MVKILRTCRDLMRSSWRSGTLAAVYLLTGAAWRRADGFRPTETEVASRILGFVVAGDGLPPCLNVWRRIAAPVALHL